MSVRIPSSDRQRLLLFNLRTDADDHILGFTTRWINAIAPYYQHVDVLTTHRGRLAVADNVTVYSTGRERGYGKVQQLAQFYTTLSKLLRQHHYRVCFAHMQPLFATLAAPLLAAYGVKLTTWYTHRQPNLTVRLAARWSYRVVTAVDSSFPIQTSRLRPLGHGIDLQQYSPHPIDKSDPPRIIHVARLTPIKNQHVLLEAARDLNCEVVLVGDIPDGYDDAYKQSLKAQVKSMRMQDRVIFAGAQTPQQVARWYSSAQVAINLSPVGLFDKAPLEGMACGLPTIVSNPAFSDLLGAHADILLIPAPDDITHLHQSLKTLLALSLSEQQQIGDDLRKAVIARHSLPELIKRLIHVMHTGDY